MAVINHNKAIEQDLDLILSQPSGQLSAYVQATWCASVSNQAKQAISKPLYSDAGSGIVFNLFGELKIGNSTFGKGVILLPVNVVTEHIVMQPGAKLAGVRFLPAIGYGVLGKKYDKATLLSDSAPDPFQLTHLFDKVDALNSEGQILEALNQWAINELDFTNVLPESLEAVLGTIDNNTMIANLDTTSELSQRQIERLFKQWLGITPKHYQRILRVKQAINYIKSNRDSSLVDIATLFGFSDQAHMTREFKAIASITPSKI